MSIWHWQVVVILLGLAGSMMALFRNRVVLSKIAIGIALTAVAVLQMGVTPLSKKVRRLEAQLQTLDESDPYRAKAEKDLHAALLALDPVQAYTRRVNELQAQLAKLEKAKTPDATAIQAVEKELATAKVELEKAQDPEAWYLKKQLALEAQERDLKADDPKLAAIRAQLKDLQEGLKRATSRRRGWKEYLPVNLGLDLSGGTEIRLRLRPDKKRLEIWKQELEAVRAELAPLKAKPDVHTEEKVQDLEKREKELLREIDTATKVIAEEFDKAVNIIRARLNNSGLAEIPVMRQGQDQVLIQLPGMDSGRAQQIIDTVKRQGKLEFRMVIQEQEDKPAYEAIRQYLQTLESKDRDEDLHDFCIEHGRPLGPGEIALSGDVRKCKQHSLPLYDYLHTPPEMKNNKVVRPPRALLVRQEVVVGGGHIIRARAAPNPTQPTQFLIRVSLDTVGGVLMELVTSNNVGKAMGIVLDGKLKSAPRIRGRFSTDFQIEGDFDQDEAEQLEVVLKSGSLKVVPEVELENTVGPTLGEDSIRRGIQSMIVGLLLVLGFMLVYYLVAGAVTDLILFVNMILIVAILSSFEATLTLPGIAGLILTVGMAVDANVLIFERIREERERGNSLSRSIQLGYERAFVTIIDANVTTFITAVILHSFGTEAVRGFAVTLIIGIVSSVFCALVLTRWVFDAMIEFKVIDDLKMLLFFRRPAIDFIRLRRPAMGMSLLCILVGISFLGYRHFDGQRNLGHDFTGGILAQIALSKPVTVEEARQQARSMPEFSDVAETMQSFGLGLDGKFSEFVLRLKPKQKPGVSEEEARKARNALADTFRGAIRQAFPSLQPEGVVVDAPQPERATADAEFYTARLTLKPPMSPKLVQQLLVEQGALVEPVVVKTGNPLPSLPQSQQAEIEVNFTNEAIKAAQEKLAPKAAGPEKEKKGETPKPPADKVIWLALFKEAAAKLGQDVLNLESGIGEPSRVHDDGLDADVVRVKFPLTLTKAVSRGELRALFPTDKLENLGLKGVATQLVKPEVTPVPEDEEPAANLTVLCGAPLLDATGAERKGHAKVQFIRDQFQALRTKDELDFTDPFPRFIKVGPTVAAEMTGEAIKALLYAMFAIFFYIWLRFQFRAAFGMGAVIALAHDVLFTMGALAVVDEFGILNGQIDLVIVAALLTIVGYSLNDTIVVFDRIRENMRGGGRALEEVINSSINQTISRTVITSVTTMLVVLALLIWGGDVIRGFAFALFVGVVVGTYSSIFIASPVLVEFAHIYAAHQKRKREKHELEGK